MSAVHRASKFQIRDILIQSVVLLVVVFLVVAAVTSARDNLASMGIGSGFSFLDRATGWSYSFALVERSIDDPYRWTLFVGFLNTLFVGLVSIVIATVLGFAIGAARDASNFAVNAFATVYVQIFRNIPLILQVVFWYSLLIHMPGPREAMSILNMVFVSNRGVMIPWMNLSTIVLFGLTALCLITGFLIWQLKKYSTVKRIGIILFAWFVLINISYLLFAIKGEGLLSIPELKGLKFRGGLQVPIELVAMIVSIVLYGAAYIAEVVRGGLQEVPKGLLEAGEALGLTNRSVWFNIKLPMALTTIIPPLGNQWIFLMKATTIGVAIGFSDLFMIVSTSITQSGQTLELIGILMASFLLINFSIARLIGLLNRHFQLR